MSYLLKMPDLENHYLLASEEADEDSVVLKVRSHTTCSTQIYELIAWAYCTIW